jgi:hypothetical protein
MSSIPHPLAYAPAPSKRRRHARSAILVVLTAAIGGGVWLYGKSVWNAVVLWYWQDRCLHYLPPADQVVYDEDPTRAASLLAFDPQLVPLKTQQQQFHTMATIVAACRVPGCWSKFCPVAGSEPILFLHERRSLAGHRRLVCVRYAEDRDPPMTILVITPSLLGRSPTFSAPPPRMIFSGPALFPGSRLVYPPRTQIYAGQIDPQDQSRFTIRYAQWGQTDTFDGWLDDNDQVWIIRRMRPTPKPASDADRAAGEVARQVFEQSRALHLSYE